MKTVKNIVSTLLRSVREYKKQAVLTPVFMVMEVLLECIIPTIMARLIDEMTGASMQPIIKYGLILLVMAMCSLFFGVGAGRFAATAGCGFAKNLRGDLFSRVQDFSFADIDRFSTASLVTRLTTDVTYVQFAFQMMIRIAVRVPLMLIFSFAMSTAINVRVALIFLAVIPVLGTILILIMAKAIPFFNRIFHTYDDMNNSVEENVSAIRVVKSFVREDYEKTKFGKTSYGVAKDFTAAEKLVALNSPIMMFFIYGVMLFLSWWGAKTITATAETELTTGELSALIGYSVQILSSMMMLSMIFVMLTICAESSKRITEVLNAQPTLTSPEGGLQDVTSGEIEFRDVSFRYSETAQLFALRDINLHIKSGQTVGILGVTGSSKSTLVQLIPRLYDVTEGSVLVAGHDVREYDLTALRESVSMVLQKNVLFAGTIAENLRWGDENATDEELVRVCKLAQADSFVQTFPDGYATKIEQGGTNVSGGQKQRLCIARALLKKPKILILDDSTSAVDTKTDALIRRAFQNEIPNTTKIIIAQRVSSVQDADLIIVMEGGTIIATGTHEELMHSSEVYAEVFTSQTKGLDAGGQDNE